MTGTAIDIIFKGNIFFFPRILRSECSNSSLLCWTVGRALGREEGKGLGNIISHE
jgi:hypothetical protein